MIYFTAHTFDCVCHSIRTMFRVLGIYNFGFGLAKIKHALTITDENDKARNLHPIISIWRANFFQTLRRP